MLAVNIGYSPRHASWPPGPKPVRRRLRRAVAILGVLGLLGAAVTFEVLRAADQPARSSAAGKGVHVFSEIALGLHKPVGLTGAGHRMWITNSAGNSVTELGWQPGERPMIRTNSAARFLAPGAITVHCGSH